MQALTQILQEHLRGLTHGLINLNDDQANAIIDLVLQNSGSVYTVQLLRFNNQLRNYEPGLTIRTTFDKFQEVREALQSKYPAGDAVIGLPGFYRYDLKDPDGNVIGNLYSINPALFD